MRTPERHKLPIRKTSNSTERKGVLYVRGVVEGANSIFKEMDRGSDYGHDAFVLLVDNETVTPTEIALQIKSGRSYCDSQFCRIRATDAQLNFWTQHPLITLGVVYDPDAKCAWWVDLRQAARDKRTKTGGATILFPKSAWNTFDEAGFRDVLLPILLGQPPRIDLDVALTWIASADADTHDLGARVLLARFRREPSSWSAIFQTFYERGSNASFSVYRGLVRIMGHPDEGYYSDEVPEKIRRSRRQEVARFGKSEVVALLGFVDDWTGFERGTPGYGLFAILPRLPHGLDLLRQITIDDSLSAEVRSRAELLLAIHDDDPDWWSLWSRA